MAGKPEFQRRLEAIDGLIARIEGVADPAIRDSVRGLVALVMELHGVAFERLLELLRAGGEPGLDWMDALARDDLLSSLLVLHGLHPLDFEARVKGALEKIRPSLKKRGGDAGLLSIQDGVPRLRLQANGQAAALKEMLEACIYQAAPDAVDVVIDSGEDRPGFVPLEMLRAAAAPLVANGREDSDGGKRGQ